MRKLLLEIKDQRPFSYNNAYIQKGSFRFKSKAANLWLSELEQKCRKYLPEMRNFAAAFNPLESYLRVSYLFLMPRNKLFTDCGTVSKKSNDCSNITKLSDDLIFNKMLGIDDGLICSEMISKRCSYDKQYHIKIEVTMAPLSEL